MIVKRISLKNFRNYKSEQLVLSNERNVIVGENAQGKTNLIEAIEFCATGRSYRTQSDAELIMRGEDSALVEIDFVSANYDQKISIALRKRSGSKGEFTEKQIKVNGVAKANTRGLKGHLATVGFKSQDMSLIRGGPKDRRDWLDDLVCSLKSGFSTVLSRYQRAIAQRNRLLKNLFEKGRLTVLDQDQLNAWDQQLSAMGAIIIKKRVECLNLTLPIAENYQKKISGAQEQLAANYHFYISSSLAENAMVRSSFPPWRFKPFDPSETGDGSHFGFQSPAYAPGGEDLDEHGDSRFTSQSFAMSALLSMEEKEIADKLIKLYKLRRADEIARRQTLSGPHRDDIRFTLNESDATSFASQGQQRSLVLSLKLAQLELVDEHLGEPPVLILDDVMAELDLKRQAFLMSSIDRGMQTLLTTTHLDGFEHFDKDWLNNSLSIQVRNGQIERQEGLAIT